MIQSQQQHHFLFSTFLLLALWSWPWPGVTFTSSSLPTGTAIDRKKNEFASPVSQSGKFGFSVPHGVPNRIYIKSTVLLTNLYPPSVGSLYSAMTFLFFFLSSLHGRGDGRDGPRDGHTVPKDRAMMGGCQRSQAMGDAHERI
ncbi:uncharacterized protein BKA78DRAFT_108692 [Phyllosticta capitalensis]|uniref:uncharacterized protein n=1 Tax=Phyllosticta capitalensis TaxID=121624 RepID=UPI0031320926